MQPIENFEQYRPLLFSIAYRMLGSAMEAEDIVQDTYLRYSQANLEEIQSHKYFLTTIVSRLALNRLQSAQAQREVHTGNWLPEPIFTGDTPYVDASEQVGKQESISLAFLLLLEKLSPAERAVFLLREVFDYEYSEIAKILEKSEESCRQVYSRAKKHLQENRPRFETDPKQHEVLLQNFLHVVENGEVGDMVQLLAQDAIMISDGGSRRGKATRPIFGALNVAKFILSFRRFKDMYPTKNVVKIINGKPAIVITNLDGTVFGVLDFELVNGKIQQVHLVADEEKLKHV